MRRGKQASQPAEPGRARGVMAATMAAPFGPDSQIASRHVTAAACQVQIEGAEGILIGIALLPSAGAVAWRWRRSSQIQQ